MLRHKEPEQSEEGSKHSAVLMDSPENPRKSTDYEYNKGKQPVSQKKIAPCKEHQSRHNIIRERSPISEKLDSVIPVWENNGKTFPFSGSHTFPATYRDVPRYHHRTAHILIAQDTVQARHLQVTGCLYICSFSGFSCDCLSYLLLSNMFYLI